MWNSLANYLKMSTSGGITQLTSFRLLEAGCYYGSFCAASIDLLDYYDGSCLTTYCCCFNLDDFDVPPPVPSFVSSSAPIICSSCVFEVLRWLRVPFDEAGELSRDDSRGTML